MKFEGSRRKSGEDLVRLRVSPTRCLFVPIEWTSLGSGPTDLVDTPRRILDGKSLLALADLIDGLKQAPPKKPSRKRRKR